MLVTVYSPKNKLYDKVNVKSVYLPSANGDMQIFDNHIPVIATLKEGEIIIEETDGHLQKVHVHHGYIQYAKNNMTIVVVDTKLTDDQLKQIEAQAIARKDTEIREEDEISEQEFLNMERSEGHR